MRDHEEMAGLVPGWRVDKLGKACSER